jgi:N-sulfoglucosamine sulfohydrolase
MNARPTLGLAGALLCLCMVASGQEQSRPPNILMVIADDWSFPHAGAYGDGSVSTPAFDRVAREGALFTRAFTAAPSCTPSRAAILTGQAIHRLAEGGNLWGFLPSRFEVYPDVLERAGYHVGHTGKGWGPGQFEPGGRTRNPAGPRFASFDEFLTKRRDGQPFAFWFGSTDPHRPYDSGSGARAGIDPARLAVPASLPDTATVRNDLADYYAEVQRFDGQLGMLLDALRRLGELDNTVVVVTSDNGMPFPRAKANLYDAGTRMPLAIRWPEHIAPGTTVEALVSLAELAPTFLEMARVAPPSGLTGRSLLPLLRRGARPAGWDRVYIERERHANVRAGNASYPGRALRTSDHLYIKNYRADRWPAGDPELHFAVGPFGDIDGGPTKDLLLERRTDPAMAELFRLSTGKRPAEELYDLEKDPAQLVNVAANPAYAQRKAQLARELSAWQRSTGDPRVDQADDRWDRYPYYGGPAKGDR